jgi:hypothetical protein
MYNRYINGVFYVLHNCSSSASAGFLLMTDIPEKDRMTIEAFDVLSEAIDTAKKYPDLHSIIYDRSGKIIFTN